MMARRMMRRRTVVGAAVAVGAVSSARRNRAERQAIEQQTNSQQEAPVEDTVQAAPQDDLTAQLEQLNDLKNKGILTQEEFDAKKKQLLGI
jgi:hypothetical protein